MAKKAKKPSESKSKYFCDRRLTKAEKALFELNASTTPNPNWTEEDGVELLERERRGDYS